jgi:hypothetical protein
MILAAVLPAVVISYLGMPSLYWAHTENGSLRLRSNLPLRPPFCVPAVRLVRQSIGVFTGLSVRQSVNYAPSLMRRLMMLRSQFWSAP